MILLFVVALLGTNVAEGQQAWERRQNTFHLRFDGTPFEVEWVSESTFRVRRGLLPPSGRALVSEHVEVRVTPLGGSLRMATNDLAVEVNRQGLLAVSLAGGHKLFTETAARISDGRFEMTLEVPAMERFYGLGPRPQEKADARGLTLEPLTPFFTAGNGYAHWMNVPGKYRYQMGPPVRIEAGMNRVEYTVAFGPSLKEIWDQRVKVELMPETPMGAQLELIAGGKLPKAATAFPHTDLCGDTRALVHASLSGVPMPAFDLGRYTLADNDTYGRAARIGTFAPIFYDSAPPADPLKLQIRARAAEFRKGLGLFLLTYADEVRARGYPLLHPLRHQFPRDPAAGDSIDAVMFGDELLLVPVCDGGLKKTVYLPPGIWTDWQSQQEHRGRRNVELPAPPDGLIVLAKNGSIVPFTRDGATELHYFPRLGGEFFFYEPDIGDYSQVHAGPAADIYRVQVESKVARKYAWVIHHMERPRAVEQVGAGGAAGWSYDARTRTVRIPVDAAAHSDIIHNILFASQN